MNIKVRQSVKSSSVELEVVPGDDPATDFTELYDANMIWYPPDDDWDETMGDTSNIPACADCQGINPSADPLVTRAIADVAHASTSMMVSSGSPMVPKSPRRIRGKRAPKA